MIISSKMIITAFLSPRDPYTGLWSSLFHYLQHGVPYFDTQGLNTRSAERFLEISSAILDDAIRSKNASLTSPPAKEISLRICLTMQ